MTLQQSSGEGWRATSADYRGVRFWLEASLKAQAKGETPEIPPDFCAWFNHLAYLNSLLSAGIQVPLLRDEMEGLRIFDEVAREVSRKLRRCPSPRCGRFTDRDLVCEHCGTSLQGERHPDAASGRKV